MPARDQQQQVGERRAARRQPRQPGGQRMRLQMVHRDEGQPLREGDALAKPAAHDQPADQPRPGGGGDAAEIGETQPRLAPSPAPPSPAGAPDARAPRSPAPRRQRRMVRHLAQHRLGEHPALGVEHRRRGLVATRLDPAAPAPASSASLARRHLIGRRHVLRPSPRCGRAGCRCASAPAPRRSPWCRPAFPVSPCLPRAAARSRSM